MLQDAAMFDATQALVSEVSDGGEHVNIRKMATNGTPCETVNAADRSQGGGSGQDGCGGRFADAAVAGHKCPLHAHDAPGGLSCVGCNELRGLAACRHLVRRVQKQARAPIIVGARAGFRFGGTERRLSTPIIPQDSGEVK